MINKSKSSELSLYLSLLAFTAFAAYILYINSEVLYTAYDRSEFLCGAPFFRGMASRPFGLTQYAGAWLTQLFYRPAVGAGVLGAIWAATLCIGARAFRLKGNAVALMLLPIACLLTSVVDVGYWIYTMTIRGYWFSQSVGYLLVVSLLWAARCAPRRWHVVWYAVGFCLYPVLGWFALLFVLCLVLVDKATWREAVGVALALLAAMVWHRLLYPGLTYEAVSLAGLPRFVTPSDMTERLTAPFWLMGVVSLLIALFARHFNRVFVPVACAVAGIALTVSLMFHDRNYIDEMRMVRHAETDDWQQVLDIAADAAEPTVSMVMLKNVALMHEGGLLDRSFQLGNDGGGIYNPDSIHASFLEIAAPIAYYNYGLINEAFRLSFECAVQSGFSPFYLKALTRSALANDEAKVAERYTDILRHRPFHASWQPGAVSEKIKELHASYPDALTGVVNSQSYLVTSISQWYESDSKLASEQALFYAMLQGNSTRFWEALRNYVRLHLDEEFPLHAQEAYILFMDKAPEKKRMMLPVNEETYARYKQFWTTLEDHVSNGLNKAETAEKMRAEFGDTYWFYNIFARKIY